MTAEQRLDTSDRPIPIGGWLVFIILLLAGRVWDSVFGSLMTLAINLQILNAHGKWLLSDLVPASAWFGNTAILITFLSGLLGLFVLKLILATDAAAPKWAIGFSLISALLSTTTIVLVAMTSTAITDTSQSFVRIYALDMSKDFVAAIIVVPYFLYSKRVKATFKL